MTSDILPTQTESTLAFEAEQWLQISDWARDAGDRACGDVLVVAVAVAFLLAAGWAWAMPSFS